MIVIYIQKSWLDTVGEEGDLLLWRQQGDNYISVLAARSRPEHPFVYAKLCRKLPAEGGEIFLPSHIPVGLVSGIFDLTQGETDKWGFHPKKKK